MTFDGGLLIVSVLVVKAHFDVLPNLPRLLAERRRIRQTRRVSGPEFTSVLARHSISVRQVAAL